MPASFPTLLRKCLACILPILIAAIFLWPWTAPFLTFTCTGAMGVMLLALAVEVKQSSNRPPTLRPQLINVWRFTMLTIWVVATIASIIAWMIRLRV